MDKTGQRVWSQEVGGPTIGVAGLVLESAGNIYVAWNRLPSTHKGVLCKLGSNYGIISWSKQAYFISDAPGAGVISAMAVDSEENVNLVIDYYEPGKGHVQTIDILYQTK